MGDVSKDTYRSVIMLFGYFHFVVWKQNILISNNLINQHVYFMVLF
jgi:hypothetical protein